MKLLKQFSKFVLIASLALTSHNAFALIMTGDSGDGDHDPSSGGGGGGNYSEQGAAVPNSDGSVSIVTLEPVTVTGQAETTTVTVTYHQTGEVFTIIPETVVVVRNEQDGRFFLAAPLFAAINWTQSAGINESLLRNKINEIIKIANPSQRAAAMRQLLTMVQQASLRFPISNLSLGDIATAVNWTRGVIMLPGASGSVLGAVTIELLVATAGLSAAAAAGTVLGTAIYNNSSWIQNGGLDPAFRVMDRLLRLHPEYQN